MKNSKIKISTNRSFGIVFFLFFLLVGLYPILDKESVRVLPIIISLILLILGLLNSKFLTPLNKIWFKFGVILGAVISPIVMGIIFFMVVTPTSILMKIFGKDLLGLKKSNSDSYWVKKSKIKSKMKNQF